MFYNEPESFKLVTAELFELTFAQHRNQNTSIGASSTRNNNDTVSKQVATTTQPTWIVGSRNYARKSFQYIY